MFRLLQHIPLTVHALVLLLTVLLRLPVFFLDYFQADESLYLLCAQKLAAGGEIYQDAWIGGSPMMVWLYSLFVDVFGDSALTVIRIVTIFYLYFTVIYFQGMLFAYKVFQKNEFAAAIFLVLLLCTPWHFQELNTGLMMIWPFTFSFHVIIRLTIEKRRNFRRLFQAGLLLMTCFLIDYAAVTFFLGIMIAYLSIRQAKTDEFFTLILGASVGLVVFLLLLHFKGLILEYWDLGLRHYFRTFFLDESSRYAYSPLQVVLNFLLSWSPVMLLGIFGFIHYRLRIYSYLIVIRQVEQTMLLWLICAAMILIFSGWKIGYHDLILFAPPFAFYGAKAWYFKMKPLIRLIVVLMLIGPTSFMYIEWVGLKMPQSFGLWSAEGMGQKLGIQSVQNRDDRILKEYLKKMDPVPQKAWIMEQNPARYHRLGLACATRYTDYGVVKRKFSYLSGRAPGYVGQEPDAEIFAQFQADMPDIVIDPSGKFELLRQRFPSLLGHFQAQSVGRYKVWR